MGSISDGDGRRCRQINIDIAGDLGAGRLGRVYHQQQRAGQAADHTFGVNWYLNKNVKLNLDYEQTEFDGGSRKPGNVTAQNEQIFFGRAQFSF